MSRISMATLAILALASTAALGQTTTPASRSIKVIETAPGAERAPEITPPVPEDRTVRQEEAPSTQGPDASPPSPGTETAATNPEPPPPVVPVPPTPVTAEKAPQGVKGPAGVTISLSNPAAVRVSLSPGPRLAVGDKLTVSVTSAKPGYLVLLDVSADGHVTQIYPYVSALGTAADAAEANRVQPGREVHIPDGSTRLADFEYMAAPPFGEGMVVAVVSDQPVQYIDLPDLPASLPSDQVAQLVQSQTRSLKITPSGGGALLDPTWSFAVAPYTVEATLAQGQAQ